MLLKILKLEEKRQKQYSRLVYICCLPMFQNDNKNN